MKKVQAAKVAQLERDLQNLDPKNPRMDFSKLMDAWIEEGAFTVDTKGLRHLPTLFEEMALRLKVKLENECQDVPTPNFIAGATWALAMVMKYHRVQESTVRLGRKRNLEIAQDAFMAALKRRKHKPHFAHVESALSQPETIQAMKKWVNSTSLLKRLKDEGFTDEKLWDAMMKEGGSNPDGQILQLMRQLRTKWHEKHMRI